MIRRCMVCKIIIGEKEPLEDTTVTDGCCDPCFDVEMMIVKGMKGSSYGRSYGNN